MPVSGAGNPAIQTTPLSGSSGGSSPAQTGKTRNGRSVFPKQGKPLVKLAETKEGSGSSKPAATHLSDRKVASASVKPSLSRTANVDGNSVNSEGGKVTVDRNQSMRILRNTLGQALGDNKRTINGANKDARFPTQDKFLSAMGLGKNSQAREGLEAFIKYDSVSGQKNDPEGTKKEAALEKALSSLSESDIDNLASYYQSKNPSENKEDVKAVLLNATKSCEKAEAQVKTEDNLQPAAAKDKSTANKRAALQRVNSSPAKLGETTKTNTANENDSKIAGMESKLNTASATADANSGKIDDMEGKLNTASATADANSGKIDDIEGKLNTASATADANSGKIDDIEGKLNTASATADANSGKIDDIEGKLNTASATADANSGKIDDMEGKLNTASATADANAGKIAGMESKLNTASATADANAGKIDDMEGKLNTASATADANAGKIDDIEGKLNTASATADANADKIDDMASKLETTTKTANTANSQATANASQLEEQAKTIEALQEEIGQLKTAQQGTAETLVATNASLQESRDEIQNLEELRKEEMAAFKKETEAEMETKMAALEEKLMATMTKKDDQLVAFKTKQSDLEEHLEKLKNKAYLTKQATDKLGGALKQLQGEQKAGQRDIEKLQTQTGALSALSEQATLEAKEQQKEVDAHNQAVAQLIQELKSEIARLENMLAADDAARGEMALPPASKTQQTPAADDAASPEIEAPATGSTQQATSAQPTQVGEFGDIDELVQAERDMQLMIDAEKAVKTLQSLDISQKDFSGLPKDIVIVVKGENGDIQIVPPDDAFLALPEDEQQSMIDNALKALHGKQEEIRDEYGENKDASFPDTLAFLKETIISKGSTWKTENEPEESSGDSLWDQHIKEFRDSLNKKPSIVIKGMKADVKD